VILFAIVLLCDRKPHNNNNNTTNNCVCLIYVARVFATFYCIAALVITNGGRAGHVDVAVAMSPVKVLLQLSLFSVRRHVATF